MAEAFTCDLVDDDKATDKKAPSSSDIEFMIDQVLLPSSRLQQTWAEVREALLSSGEGAHDAVLPPRTPTQADLDRYSNMPIYSRFNHLFEYEGNYHSYVIAQILSQDLYQENEPHLHSDPSQGLSPKMKDIYTKGGAFDYQSLIR